MIEFLFGGVLFEHFLINLIILFQLIMGAFSTCCTNRDANDKSNMGKVVTKGNGVDLNNKMDLDSILDE